MVQVMAELAGVTVLQKVEVLLHRRIVVVDAVAAPRAITAIDREGGCCRRMRAVLVGVTHADPCIERLVIDLGLQNIGQAQADVTRNARLARDRLVARIGGGRACADRVAETARDLRLPDALVVTAVQRHRLMLAVVLRVLGERHELRQLVQTDHVAVGQLHRAELERRHTAG